MTDTSNAIDYGDSNLNDTESGILDGIGGFDEPLEDAPTTENTSEPVQEPAATDGDGSGEPASGEPDKEQPAAKEPTPEGQATPKNNGDLVDNAGNVIAKAGSERRLWEKNQQQTRYIQQLEADAKKVSDQSDVIAGINQTPAQLGLDVDDVKLGMQIMGSFKKDPLSVAKWALQETLAMGYNLNQVVGEEAGGRGSIEMDAITKAIENRIGPLVDQQNNTRQIDENNVAVQKQYNAFVAKHDNAVTHEDLIAGIMRRDKTTTAEAAYWQLQAYSNKMGFDFTKPLMEQSNALKASQQQAPQTPPVPGHVQPNTNVLPQSAPMPNGSAPTAPMQQQGTFAEPDAAWDDIVSNSLRESGYN